MSTNSALSFSTRQVRWVVSAVVVLIVAFGLFAATNDTETAAPSPGGPPAPLVEFTNFDGSTATFADYSGEPLVVNFWASWCPSCVAEMSAAFRPAQLRFDEEVAFLGLSIQDERSKALRLVDETGVLFDLAEDRRGDVYVALGGLGMPFTVFIDETGAVVHAHNGPVTEDQLVSLIETHLLQ